MKLKFTDGYNKKNSTNQQEIDVEGTCVITNYDTRNKKPSQKGDLTVSVDKKTSTVMTGTVFQEDSATVNLNKNKYSIFTELASYDGDNSNLTFDDLEEAYKKKDTLKEFISNLGIKEINIRFDSHAGVMTIEFDKEIIRIDFRTWWERWGLEEDSSKISVNTNEEIPEESAPETPIKTEVQKPELAFYDEAINKIISDMNEKQIVKITKEQLMIKIKEIAKNVPCTESLVIFMMSSESFIRSAQLVGSTNKAKITVGFGHTQKAIHNYNFKEGFKISNEKAFEWLEQDIKDVIELLKHKYLPGINWEEVPQSVQDAIVDLLFNAGESKIKEKNVQAILKEASESGSYAHAAVKVSRFNSNIPDVKANLMRRCCYRFLLAIEDLPKDQKIDAMKAFDSYYKETLKIQNSSDKAMLEGDWIEAQKALGLYEEEDNVEIYRVQQGDNLWNIADKNPKTVEEIKKLNNLKDNNIYVGQRLKLPKSTPNIESV